jgi:hypothetical protein
VKDTRNDDLFTRPCSGKDKPNGKRVSDVGNVLPFSFLLLIDLVSLYGKPDGFLDI